MSSDIVYWIPGDKLQWNLNRNLFIFIQENVFENVFMFDAPSTGNPNRRSPHPAKYQKYLRPSVFWRRYLICKQLRQYIIQVHRLTHRGLNITTLPDCVAPTCISQNWVDIGLHNGMTFFAVTTNILQDLHRKGENNEGNYVDDICNRNAVFDV